MTTIAQETAGALRSEADRRHLERMLRGERWFGIFMFVDLGVAAALGIAWTVSGGWSPTRGVLVLLLLLGARAHLRQQRSARLLRGLLPPEDPRA